MNPAKRLIGDQKQSLMLFLRGVAVGRVFTALKDVIPTLTRSCLRRCLQRHGMSRLPKADREKPKAFKKHEIG